MFQSSVRVTYVIANRNQIIEQTGWENMVIANKHHHFGTTNVKGGDIATTRMLQ